MNFFFSLSLFFLLLLQTPILLSFMHQGIIFCYFASFLYAAWSCNSVHLILLSSSLCELNLYWKLGSCFCCLNNASNSLKNTHDFTFPLSLAIVFFRWFRQFLFRSKLDLFRGRPEKRRTGYSPVCQPGRVWWGDSSAGEEDSVWQTLWNLYRMSPSAAPNLT